MKTKGLVQIYTGNGKGKTTAALGLAVRARSHGLKVAYAYFHKGYAKRGRSEHSILKKLGVDIFAFAGKHPFCDNAARHGDIREECLRALDVIRGLYREKYDLLILDEINISLRDGFLKEKEIISLIKARPKNMELVLTGRGAKKNIIGLADLVSRMQKVKHPYEKGVGERAGIEY
jgi:cob(I)alamin adenosyltransferase